MKLNSLTSFIVTTYICFNSVAQASAPQPVFTPAQEARIGEIAAEYLVSHPEVLVAVSQKLQAQQEARQQLQFAVRVMDNQVALLNDADRGPLGKRKLSHAKTIFCTAVEKDERPAVH